MSKYNFDESAPDRRRSGSYKWDSPAPGIGSADNIIPLWVADMDFRTAPCIVDALQRRVAHGVFGYTYVGDDYYEALARWFRRRHGYEIDRSKVIYTSGVVPAISAIIKALTRPGEGVIVQTPVYNCFFSSIRNNGCRIVEAPLKYVSDGAGFSYIPDLDKLRAVASDPSVTMLLLCNPHNPAGRVWSRDELMAIAGICSENDVIVVSDEIHCDLTMPGYEFTSFAALPSEYSSRAIVCNSPSKAFNIAGLQIANIICGNEMQRSLVDRAINDNEVCDVNPFGVAALIAAYTQGEEWLGELTAYIESNYKELVAFAGIVIPWMRIARLEATYLVWADVRCLGIDADALEEILVREADVWVNSGTMYGQNGFIRINIACPRELLKLALAKIAPVLNAMYRAAHDNPASACR